jgi:hypothetical protein
MSQIVFARRYADFLMALGIDQPLEPIPPCETFDNTIAVLLHTTRKIRCNADIHVPFGQLVRM